jgi:HPt (histidine-containing phosphotransfer) domain-containing protein
VSTYFDPGRIAQLKEVMGAEAGRMVASMVTGLTGAIERLEAAIAAGELEPAIQAAHAARNDALMLGAGQLQAALSDLEAAARDADEPRARDAFEHVRAVWPPTREQLAGM